MGANEYCEDFIIDTTKTPEQVINFVKTYIQKNLEK